MHKTVRSTLMTVIKWGFSLGLLAYALHELDWDMMQLMLTQQDPWVAVYVVGLLTIQLLISTFRWKRVIYLLSNRTMKPAYTRLANLNFVSVFFNSCLPGTIGGDAVRAVLLKNDHFPMHLCVHSVIIDRIMALMGIFVMVILSLPLLHQWITSLPVGLLLIASAAAIGLALWLLSKAPSMLTPLAGNRFIKHAVHLLDNVRGVVFSVGSTLWMLVQAVLAHACYCISVYLLAKNIGADITLLESLVLVPPVILLMMIPVSIGGWGVREVSMVGFLALVGVSKEMALAISVQMGVLTVIQSLPGALCYLKRPRA